MSPRPTASLTRRDGAVFAAIAATFVLMARHFWWVCDDAFISFRYAQYWAAGHGLRYNLGEHAPVEGFSNFLWIVPTALVERAGGDPTLWMPILSILCGVALLALVFRFSLIRLQLDRRVACAATLSLAVFPPFAVWATSGLETMAFALAIFVVFELWLASEPSRPVAGALAAVAVCGLRTEGIAWVLVLAGLALVFRPRYRRSMALSLALAITAFSIYFLWRYDYFGLWFPNPVYTKVKFDAAVALRGFRYVVTFFLTFLTPFLLVPGIYAAIRSRRGELIPVTLMALAFPAYAIVVGGDWLAMGRFLVPGLAFVTIVFAVLLDRLVARAPVAGVFLLTAATIVVGALPGWDVHLVPESVRYQFWFRYSNPRHSEAWLWAAQKRRPESARTGALALKRISQPGDSLVFGAIGSIGYYSDLFIYDRYGLVTREVALRPREDDEPLRSPGHDREVSRGFFLKHRPTYVALANFAGDGLEDKILNQAESWRELLMPRLWRSYVPDLVEVDGHPDSEAERVVMVLRLIEEAPDDPIASAPRPARRAARAARASARWDAFFERVRAFPAR
jgi:arabinofuranosyltransferase